MEISANDVINILHKNFDYKIVSFHFADSIEMTSYEAFIYCCVTGAGYLNNTSFPFSPKGLMKVFYNAFDYNFVTGLFENSSLRYTPSNICKVHPYIFSGMKNIIPIEFRTEKEFQQKITDLERVILDKNLSPTDFIIQRIEVSKKGNGMEPFMEFITCEYFKRLGFIVENQIPLAFRVGSPDFGGYQPQDVLKMQAGSSEGKSGFYIFELSMQNLIEKEPISHTRQEHFNFIVGEAKTSTKAMLEQISKYMNTGLFSEGYEIHPSKDSPSILNLGLLTLGKDYLINVVEPKIPFSVVNDKSQQQAYSDWIGNYMKFYLFGNFTNDQLNSFSIKVLKRNISNNTDLVKLASKSTFEEIIDEIWRN